MADMERFDEPSYGTEEGEFEGEGIAGSAMQALGPVKEYLPHIIAAIAVIAVAWFAYDYFVGSLVQVTVTIRDTEGTLLENSSMKVFAEGSNEPLFSEKDSSTYSLSIRQGRYRYEANAPGYAAKRSSFDASSEDAEKLITLSKDIEVEIVDLQDFPGKLFVNGKKQFSVQLKNNSSQSQSIELLAEAGIEGFALTGAAATIPAGSTQAIQLEISVPAGTSVKDERAGEEKKAVLRVKYTEEKGEASFTLYPNPALRITLSEADFSAKARENDNKDQDVITIKNNNYFPIEDLVLSIEITSATKNDQAEVFTWFSFTEIANQPNPQQIEISSIAKRSNVVKELQVILPMTAKKELDIKGNVVLNASFFSEPIKRTLTLDIKEEAEHKIELSLSPTSPIEIEWDDILGTWEEKMIVLKARNAGQLDLYNVVFSVANEVVCSDDWLVLIENSIDKLSVGETAELKLNVSAPLAVRGQESSKYCNIRYRYDDPVSPGNYAENMLTAFLEIAPQPD